MYFSVFRKYVETIQVSLKFDKNSWYCATCRWQRLSVKTFLLRTLNGSWAGQNPQGLQCRLKKKKKKKEEEEEEEKEKKEKNNNNNLTI